MAIIFKSMRTGEVVRRIEGDSLDGADLSRMSLRGADLRGQNLRFANLQHCDLTGADLRKSCLIGADLRGAVLWDVNLEDAMLAGAHVDDDAIASTYTPPWRFPPGYHNGVPGPALTLQIDRAAEVEAAWKAHRLKLLRQNPPALMISADA